ncbi:MAG: hypothetical protein V4604_06390 [Bacteroidota bacterium]
MQLLIHNERTLSEIQKDFNAMFPYLKLEFFSKLHGSGEPSSLKFKLPEQKKIGDVRKSAKEETLIIVPDMTVADLEQTLGDQLALGVQVFRKSGGVWLETIFTDTWTLAQQNEQGEFLGTDIEPDIPENPLDRN